MQIHTIPSKGYLRLSQIIGDKEENVPAIIPIGRTTWLEGVKSGDYPKPVRLSKRTVAWRVDDILDLLDSLQATENV